MKYILFFPLYTKISKISIILMSKKSAIEKIKSKKIYALEGNIGAGKLHF